MKITGNRKIIIYIFLFIMILAFATPIFMNRTSKSSIVIRLDNLISADIQVGNYTIPGYEGVLDPDDIIKIGILNDMDHLTGQHSWMGTYLAAKEINELGGIHVGTNVYYFGLVAEDTEEQEQPLLISKGVMAAERMIFDHDPDFIIGGSRPEAVLAYREVIMDAHVPFLGTGASSDDLCEHVLNNYACYKYWFRVMPINSSSIARELYYYYGYLASYINATYGISINNIYILREDLPWTADLSIFLQNYLPYQGINTVSDLAIPLGTTQEEMDNHLFNIDTSGAQIIIRIMASNISVTMANSYKKVKPNCLIAGLNVVGQLNEYWDDSNGGCQYEITFQGVYNISKTPNTIPYWNNFIEEFDVEPLYTASGSYDAVKMLGATTETVQSINPDIIVSALENYNLTNPYIAVSGNLAFLESHDLYAYYPYNYGLFCQWQEGGNKVVLPSGNKIYTYPDSLATGTLQLPNWGINPIAGDTTPPLIGPGDDIIPDETTIYYTRVPQTIGSIKLYDTSQISNIQLINMDPPYNGQSDEGFSLFLISYLCDPVGLYRANIRIDTTNLLSRGEYHLKLLIYDSKGNIAEKDFVVIVLRELELSLIGEFDYLEKEEIQISIAAYINDVETGEPINPSVELNFAVKIRFFRPNGQLLATRTLQNVGDGCIDLFQVIQLKI